MTSVIKNGETMKTINSVKISASSRVGGRSENQDDFLIDTEKISDQSREFCYKGTSELTKQQIYIVCDGMGGEQYGQDASRKAVEYFEGLLREAKRPFTPMDIAGEIRRLNQEIVDYYRCRQARGGTTIALVMLNPDGTIEAFNIGDSPIFLVRNGKITMLSEEQSMAGIKLKKGQYPGKNTEKAVRETFFSVTWEMTPECLWTICFTAEINIRQVINSYCHQMVFWIRQSRRRF